MFSQIKHSVFGKIKYFTFTLKPKEMERAVEGEV
jgi:hypothetical protein